MTAIVYDTSIGGLPLNWCEAFEFLREDRDLIMAAGRMGQKIMKICLAIEQNKRRPPDVRNTKRQVAPLSSEPHLNVVFDTEVIASKT